MQLIQGNLDYSSTVLWKVLEAMPSLRPFSLQPFILSWNHMGIQPALGPGEDMFSLSNSLLGSLQF